MKLGCLGSTFSFQGVEAAAQPIAEGAVGGVGGFQFGDEPVLAGDQIIDQRLDERAATGVDVALPVGHLGEAGAKVGVPVGAEDAGSDDVVECFDEGVFADVHRLGVLGWDPVETVGVVVGRIAGVVRVTAPELAEHPLTT
jgi:hypothetical protein